MSRRRRLVRGPALIAGTSSIRRLEGRRWCLRRARSMEIERLYGADEPHWGLLISWWPSGNGRFLQSQYSTDEAGKVCPRCFVVREGTRQRMHVVSTSMRRNGDCASGGIEEAGAAREFLCR